MASLNLGGKRFTRLLVVSQAPSRQEICWNCICDCGAERVVRQSNLISGSTKSCGCYMRDRVTKHGHCRKSKPGLITPEYEAWLSAKSRCRNPKYSKYEYYGGRGITICDEWVNSFSSFFEHMGPRPDGHTLDRIDNDGNYEPGNCRWATWKQQAKNKRPWGSNRRMVPAS